MTSAPRLFCLDTVMVDIVMKIDALPRRGFDAVSSEHLATAGGGFNAMSAAARHGMTAIYGGRLGSGPFSEIASGALRQERIATPIASDPDRDVGFCVVLVDGAGERTFITAPGAEGGLRASDLDELDVASGDYVFLSGYNVVYPEIGAAVTQWFSTLSEEIIVAFDPGPRVMDIDDGALRTVLDRTDWLLCNADEAAWLSRTSTPEGAARALLTRHCRRGVVVRDGAAGCVVGTKDVAPVRVEGFSVEVVDTNGAGDTHNGVFLSELGRGTDLREAARRANAAAALAISQFGPATCPSRDVISQWFAEFS